VLNTSAVVAFWLGFESGSRRDQADTLVIGPSAEDAVDFGAGPARDSIMLFLGHSSFRRMVLVFMSRKPYISTNDV
jgi:hypothetical protein